MLLQFTDWVPQTDDDRFALAVILQDRGKDGVVDRDDLEARYGKTATKNNAQQLGLSIQDQNKRQFYSTVKKLEQDHINTVVNGFMKFISDYGSSKEIKTLVSHVQEPEYRRRRGDDPSVYSVLVNQMMSSMTFVYEAEFGIRINKRIIESEIHKTLRERSGRPIDLKQWSRDFVNKSEQHYMDYDDVDQLEYAENKLNELRCKALIEKMEANFDIVIKITGDYPSKDQMYILQGVMKNVRSGQPKDFDELRELNILIGDHRQGGTATGHAINLKGPFADADKVDAYGLPAGYSLETYLAFGNDRIKDFLYKLICHELGHLVAERDGADREYGNPLPAKYLETVPKNSLPKAIVRHELFAEDYSIFRSSNGEKVSRITKGNVVIPNYQKRLSYFEEFYKSKL